MKKSFCKILACALVLALGILIYDRTAPGRAAPRWANDRRALALGGLSTVGLVPIPLDQQTGISKEMIANLEAVDAHWHRNSDPEKHKLMLVPDNPAYQPFMYVGEELETVRILGLAVAAQTNLMNG